MVVRIKVSGFENDEKLTLREEKSGLLGVSSLIFNKVVDGERENVLMRLMGRFKSLRYEDLEEVYNDGCLVLWEKMMDDEFKLKEKSMVGYLVRICKNVGMHYLRKVNEDVVSLNRIMERGFLMSDDESGIEEMFDVMDEGGNEDERYEKLDRIWSKLKEVDRMILESYYVDGCKMEEIAKRIGYKNGNSVKSKKNKVLRKMMEMMQKVASEREQSDGTISSAEREQARPKVNRSDFKDLPVAA